MITYNQTNASCQIFTFKNGFLSSLAHDLKLQALKFEIKVTDSAQDSTIWKKINAVFEAASIHTVCAMKNGKPAHQTLSSRDLRDIDWNTKTAVLRPAAFPDIAFRSKSISSAPGGYLVTGELTLCGITRAAMIPVRRMKKSYVVNTTLDQRDFGITPFSALMGAMQVKPEIRIRLELKNI
ncbi:MAG: YceI family protein [Candidatus Omnitrophica bacterium]|nr:YceI family protein [Candidatus Omnitrophota bacterium]